MFHNYSKTSSYIKIKILTSNCIILDVHYITVIAHISNYYVHSKDQRSGLLELPRTVLVR